MNEAGRTLASVSAVVAVAIPRLGSGLVAENRSAIAAARSGRTPVAANPVDPGSTPSRAASLRQRSRAEADVATVATVRRAPPVRGGRRPRAGPGGRVRAAFSPGPSARLHRRGRPPSVAERLVEAEGVNQHPPPPAPVGRRDLSRQEFGGRAGEGHLGAVGIQQPTDEAFPTGDDQNLVEVPDYRPGVIQVGTARPYSAASRSRSAASGSASAARRIDMRWPFGAHPGGRVEAPGGWSDNGESLKRR